MENQMAHWPRILMIVGVLLASATEAKAQGFNPYSGGAQAGAKQPKASDGFSPTKETRAARPPAGRSAAGCVRSPAEQLQKELTARLGADYLQNPQISVLVKEFNSRYVILTGAIKNGVIPLKGEDLQKIVAEVGAIPPTILDKVKAIYPLN